MRSAILKAFPHTYKSRNHQMSYRSSVITPDVAHTHASMERIEHAHQVVNRHLDVKHDQRVRTQMAEGARTTERGKRTAPASWLLWKIFSWRLVESPSGYGRREWITVPETGPEGSRLSRRGVVVGSVMSSKDGKLSSSIAASALDGHLSHAESSQSHRHGFCGDLEQ